MRDVFNYRPQLTRDQFLSADSYTERKIILVYDILIHCQRLHTQLRPINDVKTSQPLTTTKRQERKKRDSHYYIPLSPPHSPSVELLTDPRLEVTPLTTPLKPINGQCKTEICKEPHPLYHSVEPHPLNELPHSLNELPHPPVDIHCSPQSLSGNYMYIYM